MYESFMTTPSLWLYLSMQFKKCLMTLKVIFWDDFSIISYYKSIRKKESWQYIIIQIEK